MSDQNQPGTTPQPEQPKKRHTFRNIVFGFIGFFALIIVISAVASGGDDTAATESARAQPDKAAVGEKADAKPETDPKEVAAKPEAEPKKEAAKPSPSAPGVGDAVQDGKFTFTVTKVEPGPATIGESGFGEKAQGKFVLVHVTVANHADESQMFDDSSQTLYDSQDRKFDADSEAAMYLDDAQSFLEDINPGNSVDGILVFDVPQDVTPTKLELHDSMFSGGVTVTLK